jgi:hypothetical protein
LAHAEQSIPASAEGQIEFNTPSDNIGCIYTAKGGTGTYEPQDGGPELSSLAGRAELHHHHPRTPRGRPR